MHDLLSQHVRPKAGVDSQLALAVVMSLELVFEVTSELLQTDAEQVLDQISSETNTLVCVVILIVRITVSDSHLKDLADDAPEEDCFLLAILGPRTEVR